MASMPTREEAHFEGERAQSLASYQNLLGERDSQLAAARKSIGPGSERWQRLDRELVEAEGKSSEIFAKLRRLTDGKRVSFWWFIIGATILAALEAPINKFMLDNILRGSNFDSYALSLFVTLALLILAHYAGQLARQIYSAYHEKIYFSNIVVALMILIVLLACVGALTIGRAFYSTAGAVAGGRDIFAEITKQIVAVGPWSAFIAALSDQSAFFLACLNTAGIAIAFLTAFVTHDSDKVYQSALDKVERIDRALAKKEKKYDSKVAKIAKKFGPKLAVISAAYGSQNARVIALKRSRGASLDESDQIDLTGLDTLLMETRNETSSRRNRNISPESGAAAREPTSVAAISEESAMVAPFVARDRR